MFGFQRIEEKLFTVSDKGRIKFKDKVRESTCRNNPLSMYQIIQKLNEYLKGWVAYFRTQQFRKLFSELDGWIRSQLRSIQLKKMEKAAQVPENDDLCWL